MSLTFKPITVKEFVLKFKNNENIFSILPEFSFIKPLAEKYKEKNCFCGLGEDMMQTSKIFNEFMEKISPEIIEALKVEFSRDQICFIRQDENGHPEIKCY